MSIVSNAEAGNIPDQANPVVSIDKRTAVEQTSTAVLLRQLYGIDRFLFHRCGFPDDETAKPCYNEKNDNGGMAAFKNPPAVCSFHAAEPVRKPSAAPRETGKGFFVKKIIAFILILVLLLAGCERDVPQPEPEAPAAEEAAAGLEVHFIDVGQADCILLQYDGHSMLIDGGNVEDSDLVVAYLQEQEVEKLDLVVNTHAHEDHVGGLPAVLAVFETEELWCPVTQYDSNCFEDFLYYADQQSLEPVCPDPGDVFMLGDTQITVLGPVRDDYDTNNSSIVLRADLGQTGFLFSGDAEAQAEKDILEAGYDISCTVLKAGHHGSDTSNTYQWLREANAAYVVIPVGEGNSYGHPHEEILSRFRDADLEVYRTDLQGHIVCYTDGLDVTFETGRHVAVTNPTELDGSGQNASADHFIGNVNSKKFHLPTCGGLPDEKNRIEFSSYDEAEEAGYSPCGNCMG